MTQRYPTNDPFTAGSTDYGTLLVGWIPYQPVAADYDRGRLHDAYTARALNLPDGKKSTNVSSNTTSGTDDTKRAWCRREEFQADCAVTARFYVSEQVGTVDPVTARQIVGMGVLARIQGGTQQSAGTKGFRIIDCTGYAFLAEGQTDESVTFSLVRYNAGVALTIDSASFSIAESALFDWKETFDLRLVLRDVAGGVAYCAYIEQATRDGVSGYGPRRILEGLDATLRNLAAYTEDLADAAASAYWLTNGTGSRTANTTVAPDGTTTADTLNDNDAGQKFEVFHDFTGLVSGTDYVATVFWKPLASTKSSIVLEHLTSGATTTVAYTYESGAVTVTNATGAIGSGDAIAGPGGFIRLRATIEYDGVGSLRVSFAPDSLSDASTNDAVAWGVQFEAGSALGGGQSTATAYQPVLGAYPTVGTVTGAGRCGFVMSAARALTTGGGDPVDANLVDICDHFEVSKSTNEDAVLFREEWQRVTATLGESTFGTPDALGNSGRVLMGDYTLDLFSGVTGRLERSGDMVEFDPADVSIECAPFMRLARTGDRYSQHRSVTINFTAGTTTNSHSAGILLRGEYPNTNGQPAITTAGSARIISFQGYGGWVSWLASGGPFVIVIYRYENNVTTGLPVLVASRTNASVLWTNGTPFTLTLDCRPVDDLAPFGDIDTAYVRFEMFINGTALAFDTAGNDVDITGTVVTDQNANRIPFGNGEGFAAAGDQTTRTITFDDLDQGVRGPLIDSASVVIANEGTPVDVINNILAPQFEIDVETDDLVNEFPVDSGGSPIVRPLHTGSRRLITFRARTTTPDEHHRIESFFNDHAGVEGAFFYEDEDALQIPAAYLEDSLVRTSKGPTIFGTEFRLIELLHTT